MNPLDLVRSYIDAYNAYDVTGMTAIFHQDMVFEHVSNGEVVMAIQGLDAFRLQAEQATRFFHHRKQAITSITETENRVTAAITYTATSAMDLPNGTKEGDPVKLEGQSIFQFAGGKVTRLTDIG